MVDTGTTLPATLATLLAVLQQSPTTVAATIANKTVYVDDTFGGTSMNAAMTFATTLDATSAGAIELLIYSKDVTPTVYKQDVSVTATSATLLTAAALDIDFGSSLSFVANECPSVVECLYAVVSTTTTKQAVHAAGSFYVINRAEPS